jgi:FKBP-type peptidyl-prolyl cis-trans isomerase FkpA
MYFCPPKKLQMATRFFLLGLVLIFLSFGCGEEDLCEEALPSIETYIEQNQLTVQEGEQGLRYIIQEPGGAERPVGDARVNVNYEGRLTNDMIFETTNGNPVEFTLNRLIRGWQIGIPLVGEGGRVTLFLPADIAYGNNRVGDICPNSDLIFEIELVSFVN